MQHQLAGREAVAKRAPKCPRLLGATAVIKGSDRAWLKAGWRRGAVRNHVLDCVLILRLGVFSPYPAIILELQIKIEGAK
jgi:hypothetical protein